MLSGYKSFCQIRAVCTTLNLNHALMKKVKTFNAKSENINVWFKFDVVHSPLGIFSLFAFCKIRMHVKSEKNSGGYVEHFISLLSYLQD